MVSFIIPTLGRRENLIRIVERIESNLNENCEIIIVHDSAKNGLLMEASKHSKVITIQNTTGNRNAGIQRNIGAEATSKQILIFIDDDIDLQESFFAFLNSKPNIRGIMLPEIITEKEIPFPLGDHVYGRMLVTACVIMDKRTFNTIGGFNSDLANYREDSEFFIRSAKMSIKPAFIQGVYVKHPVRYTTLKTFRSFFSKNTQEPLFHRLVKGQYHGIMQSKPWSCNANRYGFSLASYFLIFLIVMILLFAALNMLFAILLFATVAAIFLMITTVIWGLKGPSISRKPLLKFFQITLYLTFVITIIPARIIGSIRYRHFTL